MINERLKFRAYNLKTKEFLDDIESIGGYKNMNDDDGTMFHFIALHDGISAIYAAQKKADWIIMQSTGLKDKNGKLIYEGDIVFYKIGSIKIHAIVKWSYERCGWIKGYQDLSTYKKYCEVIGNIYENPELLNMCGEYAK